jgi:hypothetical protein
MTESVVSLFEGFVKADAPDGASVLFGPDVSAAAPATPRQPVPQSAHPAALPSRLA